MAYLDEAIIRLLVEAFKQGNLEPALKLVAEDAALHVPGKNRISGEYQGIEGVRKFWTSQIALTSGTFTGKVVSVLQGDGHLVLILQLDASRDGETYSWRRVNHYHIVEGRIIEGWVYESNQDVADAVFT
jgi:ketosteroid isomerase-like protein